MHKIVVVSVLLACTLSLGMMTVVHSNTIDINSFRALYPASPLSALPLQCNICHTVVPATNPYGTAYLNAGRNLAVSLQAIEGVDSDLDGFGNIAEITAGSFPGDPASVPPGPQTRYADVPATHFAFNQIEAIAAAGITGGCLQDNPLTPVNEALFCPDATLTRAQMAVFIETSLSVAIAQLPPCNGTVFNDVIAASLGDPVCRFIEAFAASGITGGCQQDNPSTPGVNEARFCPSDPVTRSQMAVFIEAAIGTIGANLPACTGAMFNDVTTASPGDLVCRFIEGFATQGITGGCQLDNPGTPQNEAQFCPGNLVTRAEMAVFLVAAPVPLLP